MEQFLKDYFPHILVIVAGLLMWRSGFLDNIIKSHKQLYDLKVQELQNCIQEKQDLKSENKSLRRDSIQRAEISEEDRLIIKQLREEVFQLKK